jgi:membrane-bound metal-dependent hydrolase YbcI (DUF457 family)
MPVTPLHYGTAYIFSKVKIGLVLPALVVGSMLPDLEPLASIATGGRLIPPRGLMHSLLGAGTLDAFLTVLVTMLLYPLLVSWIFKLEKKDIVEKCHISVMLVLSALVGTLSHVLIDSLSHEYNPLLYPFNSESFDAFVLFDNWFLAAIVVQSVLLGVLLVIFVYEVRKGTQGFWKRLLVG